MRFSVILIAAALLAGCGWFSREDPATEPAELTDFAPALEFDRIWARDAGKGGDELARKLVPSVDGGKVFVAGREGRVTAFDAESGDRLWRTDTGLRASGGPGVGGGVVILGGLDGTLMALDSDSGDELWRAPVSSEVLSVPAISGSMAVVRCIDGRVFGFDRDTGRREWIYDENVPLLSLRGTSDPVIRAGQVIVGLDNGKAVALNLSDGSRIWEQAVAQREGRTELERLADVDGRLIVVATDVYAVSYEGNLASLGLDSGQQVWSREMSSWQGLAARRTQLFLTDASSNVWSLDRRNGSSLWKQDKLLNRDLSTPAVMGDWVLVGDYDGYLHVLDGETGNLLARTKAGKGAIDVAPNVVGDTVYVLTRNGDLAAYRLQPRN